MGSGSRGTSARTGKIVVEVLIDQNEVLKKALPLLLEQAVKGAAAVEKPAAGMKKDGTPKKKRESKKPATPAVGATTPPLFTMEPAGSAAKE